MILFTKKITKVLILNNIKVTFIKELCLHDISIHTNFHKNLSINECDRMILAKKWSYMTLDDL